MDSRRVVKANAHVRDYLSHYVSLPYSPFYAVLINGPWGVGKTYLVKEFLRNQNIVPPGKHVYVSLFGLGTIEEIDAALLQAIDPAPVRKTARARAQVDGPLLEPPGSHRNVKVGDLVDPRAELYVFDDLERCEGPINKVLGYINHFVEHDGSKVIIIANEEEVGDRGDYLRRREKLVGKTLEVTSSFDDAYESFLASVTDPCRALLRECRAEIASVYKQSGLNNLRILQQTMWDFDRLHAALTDRHRKNKEAMTDLVRLLFALSFELKAGHISATDLASRKDQLFAAMTDRDGEKPPIVHAAERYPEINLYDPILSDDVVIDVLSTGIVNAEAIRSCIDASRHFVRVEEEPAWRTVWFWFERSELQFNAALDRMERQFANRIFLQIGEILHVFGLRLFLARIRILQRSLAQVIAEGKRYVDDLYRSGSLSRIEYSAGADDFGAGGYAGLQIYESDTPEFRELHDYMVRMRRKVAEDDLPREGERLLAEMERDPHLYFRRICRTNSDENKFHQTPVLATIDPGKFAASLLKLSPTHQRVVFDALKTRYEQAGLKAALASEGAWLASVRKHLLEKAEAMSPMGRHRLQQLLRAHVEPALSDGGVAY